MARYPINSLDDLRWPFVGGFVGIFVTSLLLGRDVPIAVVSAAGYTLMAVSGVALWLGRPSTNAKVVAAVGVFLGLAIARLSEGRSLGWAVASGLAGTALYAAIAVVLARRRSRG